MYSPIVMSWAMCWVDQSPLLYFAGRPWMLDALMVVASGGQEDVAWGRRWCLISSGFRGGVFRFLFVLLGFSVGRIEVYLAVYLFVLVRLRFVRLRRCALGEDCFVSGV